MYKRKHDTNSPIQYAIFLISHEKLNQRWSRRLTITSQTRLTLGTFYTFRHITNHSDQWQTAKQK